MALERSRGYVKRHPKISILGSAFLVIVIVLIGIVKSLNAPSYGTINNHPANADLAKTNPNISPQSYTGQYFSFIAPKGYRIIHEPAGSYLEDVHLVSNDHSSKFAAIGVVNENINNDAGMTYRKRHPEIYKSTTQNGTIVFNSSHNGSEITGYFMHNNLVASVSFTSVYTNDLVPDYNNLISSWRWH